MSRNLRKFSFALAAVAAISCRTAMAAPLLDLQVLGSTSGNAGTYTAGPMTVSAGQTIHYEVVGYLIPGDTNGTRTLNATQTPHPSSATAGYDGINDMSFNLASAGSFTGTFSGSAVSTSPDNYTSSVASTTGTNNGTSITGAIAGLNSGFFAGSDSAHQAILFTGIVTLPSAGVSGSSTITPAYGGLGGGIEYNSNADGTDGLGNKLSAFGTNDPSGFIGTVPLTLNATPEPASFAPATLAGCALLLRRRARISG